MVNVSDSKMNFDFDGWRDTTILVLGWVRVVVRKQDK